MKGLIMNERGVATTEQLNRSHEATRIANELRHASFLLNRIRRPGLAVALDRLANDVMRLA